MAKFQSSTVLSTSTLVACPPVQPARATVKGWCALSGMGRSATYEALGAGHLRAVKVGARTLIDVPHGLAWLDSLPPADIRSHGAKRVSQAA